MTTAELEAAQQRLQTRLGSLKQSEIVSIISKGCSETIFSVIPVSNWKYL